MKFEVEFLALVLKRPVPLRCLTFEQIDKYFSLCNVYPIISASTTKISCFSIWWRHFNIPVFSIRPKRWQYTHFNHAYSVADNAVDFMFNGP